MSNPEKKGPDWGSIFAVIVVLAIIGFFVLVGYLTCNGDSSSSNPAYDPNGFMGYSDDFWEWVADK